MENDPNKNFSWLEFMRGAGLGGRFFEKKYSGIFEEHKIHRSMLEDLDKDYLTAMGISLIGHIIAIKKHAQRILEQQPPDVKPEIKTEGKDQQEPLIKAEVKQENDEDEIIFLEEVQGEVSLVQASAKVVPEPELIQIDDDENPTVPAEPGDHGETTYPEQNSDQRETSPSTSGCGHQETSSSSILSEAEAGRAAAAAKEIQLQREGESEPEQVPTIEIEVKTEKEDNEEPEVQVEVEVKKEKMNNEQSIEHATMANDEEDEIVILEDVQGDVSVLEVRTRAEQEEELVEIDEDENSAVLDEPGDHGEATTPQQNSDLTATSPATPTSGTRKRPREIQRRTSSYRYRYPGTIALLPIPSCTDKLTQGHNAHVQLQLDGRYSGASYTFSQWSNLLTNGDRIGELDCLYWTWSAADENQYQLNLFHILSHTPQLEQLRLLSRCSALFPNYIPSPGTLELPNLKHLKICHYDDINYELELREIIKAAPKLETIDLEYMDEHDLRIFLQILKCTPASALESIKSLSIKKIDNESIALVEEELELLSKIQAINLETLYLGFSLWQDTKESLEGMLKNFINLKSLTIQGCFITNERQEPKVTVNFPTMPKLEFLSLGKSYKFASAFESITERPRKRRRTSKMIRTEVDTESIESAVRSEAMTEEEVYTHGDFFSVTLSFPSSLPNLKSLELGTLYEIEELHFSRFPLLEVFRVSSPWHLTVRFPPETSRHPFYPKLTQLQLPDKLKDHTFVQKVVKHFPNIERCWINLPTVKVLRAFSKVMLSCSDLRLKALRLKVQFDFASSLDWAFLDKPSTSRADGIAQSADELEKIRVLKAYALWEQYVELNNIDIPDVDQLSSLENCEEFRGLGSLCQRLKSLDLKISHIPRKLRLPKGTLDWNDDHCEFSNVLIGFDSMEYPYSPEAWNLGTVNTIAKHFKLPPKAIRILIKERTSFYQVDISTLGPEKKGERPDPTLLEINSSLTSAVAVGLHLPSPST